MQKPILEEMFADNGGHSHWKLIDSSTGETLWEPEQEQNSDNTNVLRSLPPVSEIEQALNLAQAEIRAMYKRVGINGSNVLDVVKKNLEAVQAAMT